MEEQKQRLSDRRIIVQISMEREVFNKFKNILHKNGYLTINEFVREKIREFLKEAGG